MKRPSQEHGAEFRSARLDRRTRDGAQEGSLRSTPPEDAKGLRALTYSPVEVALGEFAADAAVDNGDQELVAREGQVLVTRVAAVEPEDVTGARQCDRIWV